MINSIFKTFDSELVLYDEFEDFRQWNDPLFKYPYTKRKSILDSYKFQI